MINAIVNKERQEMFAMHTCRPNDDESKNLQTTQNSGILVEKSMKENIGKIVSYIQCP